MQSLTLAYRDDDRTPVIFCIREAARRYFDLEVRVVRIRGTEEYEGALFNGSCDVIIEHLEYLYEKAAQGKKIAIFCAPSKGGGLELVTSSGVAGVEEFKGRRLAVRTSGQPEAVTLWLRMMGLEKEVTALPVDDKEVGRWGQWKKVLSGECVATFMSPLYLPEALAAGLTVLPVPEIPIVGHFAQACLAGFARDRAAVLREYVKAVLHALSWMVLRPEEALAAVRGEIKERMKIQDEKEVERRFACIVKGLKARPYPTPEAVANTYAIATLEYPGASGLNPLALWDLHHVKELDDEGFIDALARVLKNPPGVLRQAQDERKRF
jgi:hypothetical protein